MPSNGGDRISGQTHPPSLVPCLEECETVRLSPRGGLGFYVQAYDPTRREGGSATRPVRILWRSADSNIGRVVAPANIERAADSWTLLGNGGV